MERKYIENLKKWLDDPLRKPLIVWGARQVGKTYLIKDLFAEKYFKNNYIYVDLRTDYNFVNYCMNHVNAKDVLEYLSIEYNKVIDKNTLIIFDEAQECLPIITLMKYFCQDFRDIPIIVTGSMVRIKIQRENSKRGIINSKFLFPIGKIDQLYVYPLNFDEFLYNINKIAYDKVVDAYNNKVALEEEIHDKVMDIFYSYLLVGGMPEVVDVYLQTKSYQRAKKALVNLYDNYLADMELYQASSESIIRSQKIFRNVFIFLNKENKNFSPSLIGEGLKTKNLIAPLDWLEYAFLIYKSSLIKETTSIPLIETNDSMFRLYLSDMGMFTYQSQINGTTFLSNETRNTLSGIFYENFAAIELLTNGFNLHYWKGKNNSEFEFLIEDNEYVIPLDVKKSKGTLNSLEKFKNHNKFNYAVKVSANRYGMDENKKILTLPFYDFFLYLKEIKEKNNIL